VLKATLNGRPSIMMVRTCPFEPKLLKNNLSTMSRQQLGNELKQNSQSFFALQILANKAEDLAFHYRFDFSQHNPDDQRCWKWHGRDPYLNSETNSVQLDAAFCSYTLNVLLGSPSEVQSCQEKVCLLWEGTPHWSRSVFVSGSERNRWWE